MQNADVCTSHELVLLERKYQCFSMEDWRLGISFVCVQPVAIRSALFWFICSFCLYLVFVSDCLAGWVYVSMGLLYCLYARVMSSLNWLIVVLVSARKTLRRVSALVFMFSVCGMKVIILSCDTPNVVAMSV